MARLNPTFAFTGSLGGFSAYTMRGVDHIILRTKGGASKKKIQKLPAFEHTRKLNAEFGGRARMSKWIMRAMLPQKPLADFNIAGPLNALMKPIQELHSEAEFGQRHIELSKNPKLLEGFSLNKYTSFDAVVRASLTSAISREEGKAQVIIPALIPGINFHPAPHYGLYQIVIVLGVVPDAFYYSRGYSSHGISSNSLVVHELRSDWQTTAKGSSEMQFDLQINKPSGDAYSLMLTIGIAYGVMKDMTHVEQVKHAGCAKILSMM
jgi:hypothetical protein